MGKTLLKGIAGLFVAFCVGMTVIAIWRAVMQTSGDTVATLTINNDPADIYAVVADPALFPDWSGWRRRDRQAVFAVHGGGDLPTTCWAGKKLGEGCFTQSAGDPESRQVIFALSPAVVVDGSPQPAPVSAEPRHEDGMGQWRLTMAPAPRGGALVTLTFEEPAHRGFVAKTLALLSRGEDERRAADMLASLRTHLRKTTTG